MEITNERSNGATVLKLSGRFDAYASPPVEDFFRTDPTPYIIVNLSDVNFIDSTGLATLVIGMKRCRQQNGELMLCGMQEPVSTIFELTHLDRVFVTYATQKEAIKNVRDKQKG